MSNLRPARVSDRHECHFGVWSNPLECLHENKRYETLAGLGSFRSFRSI